MKMFSSGSPASRKRLLENLKEEFESILYELNEELTEMLKHYKELVNDEEGGNDLEDIIEFFAEMQGNYSSLDTIVSLLINATGAKKPFQKYRKTLNDVEKSLDILTHMIDNVIEEMEDPIHGIRVEYREEDDEGGPIIIPFPEGDPSSNR